MPLSSSTERWSTAMVVLVVVVALLFGRTHHAATPAASTDTSAPLPSGPPTAATIAELQARNKGLHWSPVDAGTVLILTPFGSCGTLTALAPAHISFHTGRDDDREPHLYTSWSDAYTAAEKFCETWAAGQQASHPSSS